MFLSQNDDLRRLPVVVISGFLGSGKTTLVNRLLHDPRLADTAVAINEFGAVPLDQHLVEQDRDQTLVMANGCLCCNLAGDMEEAVMRLFARRASGALPRFARLIVEPSGLADPAPLAQAILRNPVLARALRFEGIVTLVDGLFAETQLDRHSEMRKQVALADRLVVTKPDLAAACALRRIETRLRGLNPLAPIHVARQGAIDAALLLPQSFLAPAGDSGAALPPRRASGLLAEALPPGARGDHDEATEALALFAEAPLAWRKFESWLRGIRLGHAENLLRVKGLVNVAEAPGPIVVQGLHHVLHTPVLLDAWPDADRRTRLVLLTRGMPPGFVEASWAEALPGLVVAQSGSRH